MMTTNDQWLNNAGQVLPDGGQLAYFVKLHLDTARRRERACKDGEWQYIVEGKPRPWLVLTRLPSKKPSRGRRWFLALPITSKGLDENGDVKEGFQPMNKCIDGDRESFVELKPQDLPENLLHAKDGQSAVGTPCNPLEFGNVVRIALHRCLGGTNLKR